MEKLSKSEAIRLFREHWEWVGEKEGGNKWEFFAGKEPDQIPKAHCYLCEYDEQHGNEYCCKTCLIDWSALNCLKGLYEQWRLAYNNPFRAQRLAKQIARLPERKESD